MGISKQEKTYASRFKTDLSVTQTSNVGIDATTRIICSGDGADSALSLSDDVLKVQPISDNTTGSLLCNDKGGNTILSVDTDNGLVKCGSSQVNALTCYAYFSANLIDLTSVGSHYMIPFKGGLGFGVSDSQIELAIGTGTNPDTSWDVSASAVDSNQQVGYYWYIPDAMTVDAIHIVMGGHEASTADNVNFHLMKYDFDKTTNLGDLSNGVVVADYGDDSTVTSDVHLDAIKYIGLTVDTSNNNVSAGQVVLLTVETTGTIELSCTATVKYHVQ